MTDVTISEAIDELIDIIEGAGAAWHIIGGSQAIDPYLAFQLPKSGFLPDTVRRAMEDLQAEFSSSVDARRDFINYSISVGAYYVELGNGRPVVGDGRTVQ